MHSNMWTRGLFHCTYIHQEEIVFSLSVIGDKLQVLFTSPKDFIYEMEGLLNLPYAIRENLPSDVEIAFWELSTAFAPQNRAKPGTHSLVWFNSSWVCTCRNQIVRSDSKADPRTLSPNEWHQRIVSCFARTSSLHGQILPAELYRYFTESRGQACQGLIYTRVLINKALLRL